MIRRIIQNIRKQDWTSVLIELMVVILGVVIGAQREALERNPAKGKRRRFAS